MFTGIIKAVGIVESLRPQGGDVRLSVGAPDLEWEAQAAGDSIAVNGACLTIVELAREGFAADVSSKTLAVTTLGGLLPGAPVNLEPALAVGDKLGGHLVSGHVDCVGKVTRLEREARSLRLGIELPRDYRRYLAKKGSICVDGVSLTINEVSGSSFEVNIIPHTAGNTVIGGYERGTRVNVEVDLLARYLESLIGDRGADGISHELLRAHGYA